jgi:hypothetical protein
MDPFYTRLVRDGSDVRVEPPPVLLQRGYVTGTFEWSSEATVDLSGVPDEIAILPYLWNVAPIVWASGLRLEIPSLDERVLTSLEAIRATLRQMYPSLAWDGTIQPRAVVRIQNRPVGRTSAAVLFSGGVDSVATALRHVDERPLLIWVWGSGVDLANRSGAAAARGRMETFARQYGMHTAVVRSNFRTVVGRERLSAMSGEIPGWWSRVQHGMGLTGLSAPVAHAEGITTVYIASSHTTAYQAAWGSTPDIDEQVSLATAGVAHDGYEMTRQEKLEWISRTAQGLDKPSLSVCNARSFGQGNCQRCEKCLRTIAGLVVLGEEPTAFGFPAYSVDTLAVIQHLYAGDKVKAGANELFMWRDIQEEARRRGSSSVGSAEHTFMRWLVDLNLDEYHRRKRERRVRDPREWLRSRWPSLYRLVRQIRRQARRVIAALRS